MSSNDGKINRREHKEKKENEYINSSKKKIEASGDGKQRWELGIMICWQKKKHPFKNNKGFFFQ